MAYGGGGASLAPGVWNSALGLYVLDWDEAVKSEDPHATAVEFARTVFRHA